VLIPATINAQTAQVTAPDVLPVENIADIFTSLTMLAGGVLLFTGFIKKVFKTKDQLTIWISFIVSITLAGVGWILQYGMFINLEWYYIFVYGLAAMVMANGLSTWSVISGIMKLIKLKIPEN
jgi:hypothetical protein